MTRGQCVLTGMSGVQGLQGFITLQPNENGCEKTRTNTTQCQN